MSATVAAWPENWAPIIRERLEAVGCTLEGLPDVLNRADGLELMTKLLTGLDAQLAARKASS